MRSPRTLLPVPFAPPQPFVPPQVPRTLWGMFLPGPFVPHALSGTVRPGCSYRDRSSWETLPGSHRRSRVLCGAYSVGYVLSGTSHVTLPPIVPSSPFHFVPRMLREGTRGRPFGSASGCSATARPRTPLRTSRANGPRQRRSDCWLMPPTCHSPGICAVTSRP